MSVPWRQKVIPRSWRPEPKPEAMNCSLTGLPCQHATCPKFVDYKVFTRSRESCNHREAQP